MKYGAILLFTLLYTSSYACFKTSHNDCSTAVASNILLGKKNEVCQSVFNKLKKAKGFIANDKPTLKLVDRLPDFRFVLAMADNIKGEIYIDEATFDICMEKMGKDSINGLAFILSHELAHFIKEHNVRHQFIEKHQASIFDEPSLPEDMSLDILNESSLDNVDATQSRTLLNKLYEEFKELSEVVQIRKNEAEADLEGGFISYLAGYDIQDAAPRFLDLVYDEFSIDRSEGKYASLDERKEITHNAGLKLDTLIGVFEMANFLSISKEFNDAELFYAYILDIYRSKELYNNIGLMNLYIALEEIGVIDYALPLTIDMQFERDIPIEFSTSVSLNENENGEIIIINPMLVEMMIKDSIIGNGLAMAIENFNKASRMNKAYHVPDLNLSLTYFVKHLRGRTSLYANNDNLIFALSYATQAKQKILSQKEINNKALSDIYLQLGIVYLEFDDNEKAIFNLNKALEFNANNLNAKKNLALMSGDSDIHQDLPPNRETCSELQNFVIDNTTKKINENLTGNWDAEIVMSRRKARFVDTLGFYRRMKTENYTVFSYSQEGGPNNISSTMFFKWHANEESQSMCTLMKVGSPIESLTALQQGRGELIQTVETESGKFMQYMYMPQWVEINNKQTEINKGVCYYIDQDNKVKDWILFSKMK